MRPARSIDKSENDPDAPPRRELASFRRALYFARPARCVRVDSALMVEALGHKRRCFRFGRFHANRRATTLKDESRNLMASLSRIALRLLAFASLLLATGSIAVEATARPDDALARAVRDAVTPVMHANGIPGMSVAITRGGESRVFEADGPSGVRFTLSEPWSVLLLDDHRVIHESTPIQPDGDAPHRDTLVLTYRHGGFLEP